MFQHLLGLIISDSCIRPHSNVLNSRMQRAKCLIKNFCWCWKWMIKPRFRSWFLKLRVIAVSGPCISRFVNYSILDFQLCVLNEKIVLQGLFFTSRADYDSFHCSHLSRRLVMKSSNSHMSVHFVQWMGDHEWIWTASAREVMPNVHKFIVHELFSHALPERIL